MFQNNKLKNLNFGQTSLIFGSISALFLMTTLLPSLVLGRFTVSGIAGKLAFMSPGLGAFSIIFGLIAVFTNKGRGSGIVGIVLSIIGIIPFMILIGIFMG